MQVWAVWPVGDGQWVGGYRVSSIRRVGVGLSVRVRAMFEG